MNSLSLTKGKVSTALIKFAVPFLLANLLQALYGAVDLFVVGQFDTSSSVSAVAIGSQLMQTITGIVLGIAMGGTVLIGHCIGKEDQDGSAKAVGTMTVLFCIVAIILTPIMLLCSNMAIAVMQTPKAAVEYTRQYVLICSCGIPFIMGYNAVSGIYRGMGDSKTPMVFIFIACLVNIGVDFLLVGGFKMGAAGAAYATVLAQAVSFLISLLYIRKRGFGFAISKEHFKIDKKSLTYILKVGSPIALQDALVNVSFLIITAIVNDMGLIASASVGVVEKIIVFAMLVPTAFGSAVATMTSQNMGADKPERAKKALQLGIGYSLLFGTVFCLYSQFFASSVTSVFSTEKEVITMAGEYLQFYSLDCIFVSFIFCFNGYFSGCGKSIVSFAHSMIATFGFRIPISYFVSQLPQASLFLMGIAAPVASIVSVSICIGYILWFKKKKSHPTLVEI